MTTKTKPAAVAVDPEEVADPPAPPVLAPAEDAEPTPEHEVDQSHRRRPHRQLTLDDALAAQEIDNAARASVGHRAPTNDHVPRERAEKIEE